MIHAVVIGVCVNFNKIYGFIYKTVMLHALKIAG
jgi:hypothetical protein